MKRAAYIMFVFAFLIGCASTGQSPDPPPQVGDNAPDFSIADVSGKEIKLSSFKGEKNVVLFFYANGTWPICNRQLVELQEKISEFEKLNAEVIAIAKMGDQFDVETTKSAYKISYTLIPTPNRAIAEDFGVSGNKFGIIIIDKKGRIRYKDISIYMQHSVTIILRELQGI